MGTRPVYEKEPCEMDAALDWLAQIPREEVPWYPTVNPDACVGHRECIDFCPRDVFRWDAQAGQAVVAAPDDCVIGCRDCKFICPGFAISFPSAEEWQAVQNRLRTRLEASGRPA